jgi:DNA repair exonuclease SbcCD nuclease subunit
MVHGSLRIEGRLEDDAVIFTEAEIAASGLDYLALGHWHSFREGRSGGTSWAYAGAPEPVAVDQDGAGQVVIVELVEAKGQRAVTVAPRPVGRTRFQKLDIDAAEVATQAALVDRLAALADPDLVLDARVTGVEPDQLEIQEEEVERQLAGRFLKVRVRNVAVPAPIEGELPPPDTVAGAFMRDLDAQIAAAGEAGDEALVSELRETSRLGRLLLEDPTRVTVA